METDLSPELLQQIKQAIASGALNLGQNNGRSPLRPRQLHDLRLLPTKDDPRPTFFWSAEAPRDAGDLTRTTEFPKLMWHSETGEEIVVQSAQEQAEMQAESYVLVAPIMAAPTADQIEERQLADLRAALEALTPEDRKMLIEGQRKQRLDALQAKMAGLPDASLEVLLTDAKSKAAPKQKSA